MEKLIHIQGGRPGKKRYDQPGHGTVPKFKLDTKKLLFVDDTEDEELGWGIIWENGLPYREDMFTMEKSCYYKDANGMYHESGYTHRRHKSRVYTWRFPNDPIAVPEHLRGLIDVPGMPLMLKKDAYATVGGEHHYKYGKRRGTNIDLPNDLHESYGYYPKDNDHVLMLKGTVVISAGRVLTDRPERPDMYIIITSVGQFAVHSMELFEPLP